MNREYKFRGKESFKSDYFPAKWWYGGIMIDGEDAWLCVKTEKKGVVSVKVDRHTIGQYTGIKDKNGTEIYEGDIVNWLSIRGTGFVEEGIVEFRVNEQAYVVINRIKTRDNRESVCNLLRCRRDLKVIGNIYDNPELINRDEL